MTVPFVLEIKSDYLCVNKKEVLRYLNVREMDEDLQALYSECSETIKKISKPKAAYIKTDIAIEKELIDFGFMKVKSQNLATNLMGCTKAFIFCTTLGIEVDRYMERYSHISQAKSMVLSAVASSYVESCCEYVNHELAKDEVSRPRYSPGYGDLNLECQGNILNALCAGKIGVTLTDSYLMKPIKSVTAIIGIK